MTVHELRDPREALEYLVQTLWLQRVTAPRTEQVAEVLNWALELAGGGDPLPPLGLVADLGQIIFHAASPARQQTATIPGWPASLGGRYEDHVLGKLYADHSFERGSDAVRRYQGRDRARALAFLLRQFQQRAGFGGVHLSPAVLKQVRDRPAADVLALGWESLDRQGPLALLPPLYEDLTSRVRNVGSVLAPEDVFELEHGTALAQFSQRLALRQILQAAIALEERLPAQRVRPLPRRHEVPTRILEEDAYPVGGFVSISNRGSIESLLHSQLAFMEKAERPDLFDVKFLRDELLFYSRDENQFLRRRRTFVFALFPDLEQARCKDPTLPWQRIVVLLGLLLAAVRKLLDWLSGDALVFEFVFVQEDRTTPALQAEQSLLEMALNDQIGNGTVVLVRMPRGRLMQHCQRQARRSQCHCLTLSTADQHWAADGGPTSPQREQGIPCLRGGLLTGIARMVLAGPSPSLAVEEEETPQSAEADEPIGAWAVNLERLLASWL